MTVQGNRQLNAAIHRAAITQTHYHDDAQRFLQRRRQDGDTEAESIRALKRRLSDVINRALLLDAEKVLDADQAADPAGARCRLTWEQGELPGASV